MRIWNIEKEFDNSQIELSDTTVLKKQDIAWYHLVRDIDGFFNNKTSNVRIYEDTQLLNKKDWECYFIPFDAQVQLEKITTKSPLKEVQDYASDQITYSPFYNELQEIWEQLNDDLQFVNQDLQRLGIIASLMPFTAKNVSNFLTFQSKSTNMTPIQYKQLLLNVALRRPMNKKVLIILELPELYATKKELETFWFSVKKATEQGYYFLIVTDQTGIGQSINYIYQESVINDAVIEQMKFKVMKEVPFFCDEEMYVEAKNLLFKVVDNSIAIEKIRDYTHGNYGAIITIIYVLLYYLNVDLMHDLPDIETNLKRFVKGYLHMN